MDAAPDPAEPTEDDRSLMALVGAISAVVAAVELVRRYVAESLGRPLRSGPVVPAADVVIGVVAGAAARAMPAGRIALKVLRPVSAFAVRPPLLPERLAPITWLQARGREGTAYRTPAAPLLHNLVPMAAGVILDRIDLTSIVIERVEIDRIIDEVDLNGVVSRVDLNPIVDRVDIDAIVARLDLDSIVARVDIDAVAARLDIDAVIDRIDLAALAREVIDEIDLPEIIRESTGIMTSEAVLGVRMQGIRADDGVNRVVDKLLLRRGVRKTQVRGGAGAGDETQG